MRSSTVAIKVCPDFPHESCPSLLRDFHHLFLSYIAEHYEERPLTPASDAEDPFDNYYNFHDEDMTEYLQLGPLQLKLLSLTGEPKPLHVQGGTSHEEVKARDYNPENWPVTQPMMKTATGHRTDVY